MTDEYTPIPLTEATVAGCDPVHLLRALCDELEAYVEIYADRYESGRGRQATGPVKIHRQVMPKPRGSSAQTDVPCLLVYLMDGEANNDTEIATVGILVKTVSEDDAGAFDALHLAMAIRGWLLEHLLIGDGKYRRWIDDKHPLKWTTYEQLTPEQRTHPDNYVHLQVSYLVPTVLGVLPEGVFQP